MRKRAAISLVVAIVLGVAIACGSSTPQAGKEVSGSSSTGEVTVRKTVGTTGEGTTTIDGPGTTRRSTATEGHTGTTVTTESVTAVLRELQDELGANHRDDAWFAAATKVAINVNAGEYSFKLTIDGQLTDEDEVAACEAIASFADPRFEKVAITLVNPDGTTRGGRKSKADACSS